MENRPQHYEGSEERSQKRSVEQNQRNQERRASERRANFAAMGMLAERTLVEHINPAETRSFEPKRFERLAAKALGKEALSPEQEAVPEIMYERRHEMKDEAGTHRTTGYIDPQLPPEDTTVSNSNSPVDTTSAPHDDDQPAALPATYSSAVRRGFYAGVAVIVISIMVYLIAMVIE